MKAFPCHPDIDNPKYDGMDLRDYFAAKALQGSLARGTLGPGTMATLAYEYADAMMKARKK